jgi:hypothetical protein
MDNLVQDKKAVQQFSVKEYSDELTPLLVKKHSDGSYVRSLNTCFQAHGEIKTLTESDQFIVVLEGQEEVIAKRAVSCLHVPSQGDKVLVSGSTGQGVYILAVLESNESQRQQTLKLPDECVIQGARLSFSTDSLLMNVNTVGFDFSDFKIEASNTEVLSRNFTLHSMDYKKVSDVINISARALSTNAKNANRFVSGTDRVKAMNIDYSAEVLARFTGEIAVINGTELLKTDGKLMMAG